MTTDPVVMLSEELGVAESALATASKIYNQGGSYEDGELVTLLLARIRRLFNDLYETTPTSALGASHLVRMAARRLPFRHGKFVAALHDIGERLSTGQRSLTDLMWLRGLEAALMEGVCGPDGIEAAPLLALAIKGVARPVTVYRAELAFPQAQPWATLLDIRSISQKAP